MVVKFFVTPVDLLRFLKYMSWSLSDLKGRGEIRQIRVWMDAIADLVKEESSLIK